MYFCLTCVILSNVANTHNKSKKKRGIENPFDFDKRAAIKNRIINLLTFTPLSISKYIQYYMGHAVINMSISTLIYTNSIYYDDMFVCLTPQQIHNLYNWVITLVIKEEKLVLGEWDRHGDGSSGRNKSSTAIHSPNKCILTNNIKLNEIKREMKLRTTYFVFLGNKVNTNEHSKCPYD